MLINITSFISGPRQIENASATDSPNVNQLAVSKAVNGYIEYYEPIYLSEMLGSALADQVTAYAKVEHKPLATEATDEEEVPTDNEEEVDDREPEDPKMESLIALLKEPLADYVFFHILRDMNTQATITGLVRLKCANDYVPSLDRGVRIWNNMVKRNREIQGKIANLGFDVRVDKNMLSSINTFNL